MCGIIGYCGDKNALSYLIGGLEKLKYRGYDSSGVALLHKSQIKYCKCTGKLENLKASLKQSSLEGKIGIGHTRWATHGAPDYVNAHPHLSNDKKFALVHNGIIENHKELKLYLEDKGYTFKSQTDTEVIPNLISYYYKDDFLEAVTKAAKKLRGSYALCIINRDSEEMIATKKDSPLVIGLNGAESFVASDMYAIADHAKDMYLLTDGEFAVIKNGNVSFYNSKREKILKEIHRADLDSSNAEKGGYRHFMIKEIYEQPRAIKNALSKRISIDNPVRFDNLDEEFAKSIEKIYIVACGTAYHAGLVGKTAIEAIAKTPVETDIASEFRYRNPIIGKNTLITVISQSGETADTLAALRLAKEKGAKVLAVTNVEESTIAREADYVYYTGSGPEIAVASTKAYTAQLISMYNLALFFAQSKAALSPDKINKYKVALLDMPSQIEKILDNTDAMQKISKKILFADNIIFMGRGIDRTVAMEGALKLKEITYIHAQAYAAGELKHGPIALIDSNTPVLCICTQDFLFAKTESNVKEVIARGADVWGILSEGMSNESYKDVIYVPRCMPVLSPLVSAIPLQLIAYYTALYKNLDPDMPRNLAKSVTVE